jgi:RNA polymerase sigma factor (TIGR02999 family)
MQPPHEVTALLAAWNAGDRTALEKLTPFVYDELHRLAKRYMAGERTHHTLQATALVNEAYARLIDWKTVDWQNRAHFIGTAAKLMRRVLVDYARSRAYDKRGGAAVKITLYDALLVSEEKSIDLLDLERALTRLEQLDQRKSKVIELRFFGGLTLEETAEVLNLSPNTVSNDWSFSKTWLLREMNHHALKE